MSKTVQGRILKVLAGFYFVDLPDGVLRCRARGRLKVQGAPPLVGDVVMVEPIDGEEGTLTEVLPRRNVIQRPAAANIEQLVVMAAFAAPDPNRLLVDRMLVTGEYLGLRVVLCLNKNDLLNDAELARPYIAAGYPVVELSLAQDDDLAPLLAQLSGRVSVLAGQSGVGKSSLLRRLRPSLDVAVGEVSEKTSQGKHTTRHVELIKVPEWGAYIVDTPGFSRLEMPEGLKAADLSDYLPEMNPLRASCRFGHDCRHITEPGCAVKAAVDEGVISRLRYDSYVMLYNELEERERSQYR